MPTLPTLTVTQAQADRMLASFGSQQAYLDWLKNNIIEFVLNKEAVERQKAWQVQEEAARVQARAELT